MPLLGIEMAWDQQADWIDCRMKFLSCPVAKRGKLPGQDLIEEGVNLVRLQGGQDAFAEGRRDGRWSSNFDQIAPKAEDSDGYLIVIDQTGQYFV